MFQELYLLMTSLNSLGGYLKKRVDLIFMWVSTPFLPPGFVNSQNMNASEVIHWLCMRQLRAKKTVTALFLIAEFKPMQLFVLLGIKPSLFCATTSAEKLGMHMDLLYHLYCWERELLSFTVHDC